MSEFDLGPCCACEGTENVRNIVQLHTKSPTPGKGWGCFVCDLPLDGAFAVVCDQCIEGEKPLRFVCTGYPGIDGRTPIEQAQGSFEHDSGRHEAYERAWEARERAARISLN